MGASAISGSNLRKRHTTVVSCRVHLLRSGPRSFGGPRLPHRCSPTQPHPADRQWMSLPHKHRAAQQWHTQFRDESAQAASRTTSWTARRRECARRSKHSTSVDAIWQVSWGEQPCGRWGRHIGSTIMAQDANGSSHTACSRYTTKQTEAGCCCTGWGNTSMHPHPIRTHRRSTVLRQSSASAYYAHTHRRSTDASMSVPC